VGSNPTRRTMGGEGKVGWCRREPVKLFPHGQAVRFEPSPTTWILKLGGPSACLLNRSSVKTTPAQLRQDPPAWKS